jgi:hypothetical protein
VKLVPFVYRSCSHSVWPAYHKQVTPSSIRSGTSRLLALTFTEMSKVDDILLRASQIKTWVASSGFSSGGTPSWVVSGLHPSSEYNLVNPENSSLYFLFGFISKDGIVTMIVLQLSRFCSTLIRISIELSSVLWDEIHITLRMCMAILINTQFWKTLTMHPSDVLTASSRRACPTYIYYMYDFKRKLVAWGCSLSRRCKKDAKWWVGNLFFFPMSYAPTAKKI